MSIAVRAILAASLFSLTAASARQIDTLYMFSGTGGAMAYSIDQTGANLPQRYAPWKFVKAVATSGWTFKGGADKRSLREVKKHGYSVSIIEVTIGPERD
ncbi:hypothetical protein [Sphingomonas sp. ERG5]|uniref:hypothetical protein n=1 Tax=Sphingomonas sp. ERG5 TaxID=1381597 RepID=UPI00054C578F|nr:hypothetical protein [Sphingomonas sp. ERG5]